MTALLIPSIHFVPAYSVETGSAIDEVMRHIPSRACPCGPSVEYTQSASMERHVIIHKRAGEPLHVPCIQCMADAIARLNEPCVVCGWELPSGFCAKCNASLCGTCGETHDC